MKTTYTLIVGDSSGDDQSMTFYRIDSISTFDSLDAALDAGEAALQAGADSWCIPETYEGRLSFTCATQEA